MIDIFNDRLLKLSLNLKTQVYFKFVWRFRVHWSQWFAPNRIKLNWTLNETWRYVTVPDGSRNALLEVIKRRIRPGSIKMSGGSWKAYRPMGIVITKATIQETSLIQMTANHPNIESRRNWMKNSSTPWRTRSRIPLQKNVPIQKKLRREPQSVFPSIWDTWNDESTGSAHFIRY